MGLIDNWLYRNESKAEPEKAGCFVVPVRLHYYNRNKLCPGMIGFPGHSFFMAYRFRAEVLEAGNCNNTFSYCGEPLVG